MTLLCLTSTSRSSRSIRLFLIYRFAGVPGMLAGQVIKTILMRNTHEEQDGHFREIGVLYKIVTARIFPNHEPVTLLQVRWLTVTSQSGDVQSCTEAARPRRRCISMRILVTGLKPACKP